MRINNNTIKDTNKNLDISVLGMNYHVFDLYILVTLS